MPRYVQHSPGVLRLGCRSRRCVCCTLVPKSLALLMRMNPDPDGERRVAARARLTVPPRRRRLRRWLLGALGLWVVMTVTPVALMTHWGPPGSAFMAQAWLRAQVVGPRDFSLRWQPVPLSQMSLAVRAAVVAAEDQRFMQHHGFDLHAIDLALTQHREGRGLRGASTISQQVAKNLFLWPGHSWLRKGVEAWLTLLLETLWSKPRILEVYLNVAQFGAGIYGVEAASQHYFGRNAATLSTDQAALLAAVLPNPLALHVAAPSRYLRQRQAWIRRQMNNAN